MAAALTKSGLLKTRNRRSLHYLWNRSIKCSIPDPVINTTNSLHQPKRFSRFTHTVFRKTKEVDFSAPSTVSSHFSSRASSSSQKTGLVGWYLNMLKTRPISTKCITSALIYTAADVSSQTIVKDNLEQYDLMRTLRMGGYGMLIIGPSVHYWYNFMSRVFPKRDIISTFKKIALGQTTYGPAMTVIFLSVNAALQDCCVLHLKFLNVIATFTGSLSLYNFLKGEIRSCESGPEIVARLKRDFLPTMINCVMYWPVCDFVTFKFIPVHLQPLVTNSFSYLWTVYLTYMASLAKVGSS
ncbi:hypothetical protein DH2020_006548 [Rehmannia glutinosa]|uniref:PXMP2/4 family protein n=1 Tax=Rehmannia glutinosa TaxID=99300 RepID=A0ABR0XJH5_REHGL